ncbi:EF-hand domain-containing protein [Acidovorax radicis]|jgi:hypothetical protein|uniref:EF-hand domain-containing protein n=1 Tax=Acidovorax radicis TaxID=758826 RepID=UPI001CF8A12C|nr:EF-hand domain-containing protein [Acidovorax radicis]UCU99341.1 EF-hand domain-containing protein [Acidovorax radicis]
MKALQRRTYSFDTRSVMLFAALSLGGAGAMHAQAQTSSSGPQFGPGSKTTSQAAPSYSVGPGSSHPAVAAASAFDRADSDKDGQLNAKEATKLPAISQRFNELDTDKSGTLSRAEFDKGVNS